ncbi:unnamed protein product [Amoebophrya sp. A25]|nr:unnamed protein product [Amoebophrya sp. A25]|eukprot:GSA25T00015144001.1
MLPLVLQRGVSYDVRSHCHWDQSVSGARRSCDREGFCKSETESIPAFRWKI